jgi:WD40 repeat protein
LWLKDRYRAIATIGQGGFGRTFLAVDQDKPSQPRCVIKQFLPLAQNPRTVKKAADLFAKEAMRLEELGHHPQIPELLAYFNQEGQQYLIQEFVYGKNLADVLTEQGPLSESQIRELLTSLLPVLDFIHAHKVIHRDIKPGNIISTAAGRLGMGLPLPGQTDWAMLQQALTVETNQGFKNFVAPSYRFSELLSFSLSQSFQSLPLPLYNRAQQLAIQCARYPSLPLAQRQYLVADASRLLFEMRQAYEAQNSHPPLGHLVLVDFGAAKSLKGLEPMKTGTTIGSPEYVAPEQARGKAVFASDLYSLGITCIHLLTQVSPYDLFDAHKNCWIWRQYLPQPISDSLGLIVDRLLEAAIPRRYQSALEVLQEVEGHPVAIAPSSSPIPPLSFQTPASQPTGNSPSVPTQPAAQFPAKAPVKPISAQSIPAQSIPAQSMPAQPIAPRWRTSPSGPRPAFQPSFRIAPRPQPEGQSQPQVQPQMQSPPQVIASPAPNPFGAIASPLAIAINKPEPELSPVIPAENRPETKNRRRSQPSWQCVHTFESPGRIQAIALSPTAPILASSSGNLIKLWDLENLQPIRTLTGHLDIIPALAISPDGKLLISGSADKTIHLWEVQTGKRLSSLRIHSDTVLALAISPNGQLLASSSFYDPIILWDLNHWQKRHAFSGHSARIDTLTFSPLSPEDAMASEGILASGSSDMTIKLWDIARGEEIRTLEGHTHQITDLAFSPDGNTLVSGSWDGTVKFWNLKTRRQGRSLEPESGHINAIALSSDGKKLIVASDTLQIWPFPSGKKVISLESHSEAISTATFGNDNQTLISGSLDRSLKIWKYF